MYVLSIISSFVPSNTIGGFSVGVTIFLGINIYIKISNENRIKGSIFTLLGAQVAAKFANKASVEKQNRVIDNKIEKDNANF